MAEILLFHHAHGITQGMRFLAERLRAAGHIVHTPDLFEGHVFGRLDEGIQRASQIGHAAIEEHARGAFREFPHSTTVIGVSMGAFPAQLLAQEAHAVRHCALVCGGMPPGELRGEWRHDVRLALHMADPDESLGDGALEPLLAHAPHAEVYRYRGAHHLFIDPSCRGYDADAADLFEERLLEWLVPA